jgi:hypothetical protein
MLPERSASSETRKRIRRRSSHFSGVREGAFVILLTVTRESLIRWICAREWFKTAMTEGAADALAAKYRLRPRESAG